MSIFAGIYTYDSKADIEENLCVHIRKHINRSPENEVIEFKWPGAYIVHVDVGAFGHQSYVNRDDGGSLIVAGQLLIDPVLENNRLREIEELAVSLAGESIAKLRVARGTFCLVDYEPCRHRLVLAVDRVGVRPIYCYDNGRIVIFSTVLRLFESLAGIIKLSVDMQGVTELNVFGYPLADRTPFNEVRCLRSGVAHFIEKSSNRELIYWRWDQVPDRQDGEDEAAKDLYKTFVDAVRIRNGSDRVSHAFLSGGLDSRCVVTALNSIGSNIYSYNISVRKSYDEIIGAKYSEIISTHHYSFTVPEYMIGLSWFKISALLLNKQSYVCHVENGRSRILWSGDGGSVGIGRVYMNKNIVQSLRSGDIVSAANQYMIDNNIVLARGIFHANVLEKFKKTLLNSVTDELNRFNLIDKGKALFLFLLENDQRRHMSSFYEEIDINRIEYQMPFFDGEFISSVVALPLDVTLYHHFYNNYWLRTFGSAALSVSWQAYPGHEPCPLESPEDIRYQWSMVAPKESSLLIRIKMMRMALKLALSRELPTSIFSRMRLFAVGISNFIFQINYTYIFVSIESYIRYLRICKKVKINF